MRWNGIPTETERWIQKVRNFDGESRQQGEGGGADRRDDEQKHGDMLLGIMDPKGWPETAYDTRLFTSPRVNL